MIIGAGGVGSVVAHKCAQVPSVFSEIILASRTKSKCDALAQAMKAKVPVTTFAVDADNVPQLTKLLKKTKPQLVINVALPYQDLHIMDACLAAGVNYLDTANYEPLDTAKFEYKWQWAYQERFQKAGLMALLGSGFDPGVTSVFTTYLQKHVVPKIKEIDIIDCNAGSHGLPFATNFSPEINIREITINCTRITNTSVCNGCWNNPLFKFDKGNWNWCPEHEGTERQFECHKSITSEMVINQIQNLIK